MSNDTGDDMEDPRKFTHMLYNDVSDKKKRKNIFFQKNQLPQTNYFYNTITRIISHLGTC